MVDNQPFGLENWSTSVLVTPEDFGKSKASTAEGWLRERTTAKGYAETIESFRSRCGREFGYPRLIVNGLDNIAAITRLPGTVARPDN